MIIETLPVSLEQFVIIFIVILFAYSVRSLTGLGSSLITISLLSFLLPVKFILGLDSILELFLLITLFNSIKKVIRWDIVKSIAFGSIIGVIIGGFIIYQIPEYALKKIIGLIIILAAFLLYFEDDKIHIKPKYSQFYGLLAGITGTVSGATASPYGIYLTSIIKDKEHLRATLLSIVFIIFIVKVFVFSTTEVITLETVYLSILLIPAILLASLIGTKLFKFMNYYYFEKLILLFIVLGGMSLLFIH